MHHEFIVSELYGLEAAALIGVILATVSALFGWISKVERYAREIIMVRLDAGNVSLSRKLCLRVAHVPRDFMRY